jgi:Ca2+-transporting ATPase
MVTGDVAALSGGELDTMDDTALERGIEKISVYARVSAEHKLRIVRAWKKRGAVVAMTGDGVNEAPGALRDAEDLSFR